MLKYLHEAMFFNHHVVLVNANSDDVIFFSDDMGLVNVDLNNFSLDYDNFDIAYPETIIPVRLMASCNRYKQQKVRKKKKERIIPVTWHPTIWLGWFMSKDKKEIQPFFDR